MYALPAFRAPVVTVGSFDGVHRGHLHLLEILNERAKRVFEEPGTSMDAGIVGNPEGKQGSGGAGETVVVTFAEHPRRVLDDVKDELMLLTTQKEKELLLSQAGVDNLVVMPFDERISRMSPEEFVRNFLVARIGVAELVVGYNHRLGRGREGDVKVLRRLADKYGFRVFEASKFEEGEKISSTQIREAICRGDIAAAERMLGRRVKR